jgi:hypothetical protein
MNSGYQRKLILQSQTSCSNFVRQPVYYFGSSLVEPRVLSVKSSQNEHQQDASNELLMGDVDDAYIEQINREDIASANDLAKAVSEQQQNTEEVEETEEIEEAERNDQQETQDLTMNEIYGQDPDFFFNSKSRSDLEQCARAVSFPKVVIMVSHIVDNQLNMCNF